MGKLDIFFLYVFVITILFILNLIVKIIKNVMSEEPNKMKFTFWEKISNYFLISYFITYILIQNFH